MDRRAFVATIAGVIGAGLPSRAGAGLRGDAEAGLRARVGTGLRARGGAGLQTGPSAFRELRRGVGVFTGPGGTIGWLATPDAALIVDSQFPESAAACLQRLRQRTRGAMVLVNTHHHGDHTAGNPALRPAVRQIVQHERCAAAHRAMAAAAGTGAQQAFADVTFADRWSATVGDERVTATYYGPAHTSGDAVIHFERANVVHLGDYVFHGIPPFVDRANGASIRNWIVGLEKIAAAHRDALFFFGHGRGDVVTGGVREVRRFRDYLSAVIEVVQRGIAAGEAKAAIVVRPVPGFPEVTDLAKTYSSPIPLFTVAHVLGAAYDELTGP